jgi:uncharacterized protein YyaL (SSP411 family)
MRFLHLVLVLFLTQIVFANALKYETSPYLLQHDKNPVNWYAWSEKTFALAKKEHKPIYVSIGYSTCHWCHKMAEESFENEEIAKLFEKMLYNQTVLIQLYSRAYKLYKIQV